MRLFVNRRAAGRRLAAALQRESLREPVIVAVPRGGVPVAYEVALALAAPLEVVLVRKLGAPYRPELAVGAIADGDPPVVELDEAFVLNCGGDRDYVDAEVARQDRLLRQRRHDYGAFIGAASLRGRTAVLVDDGTATGATVRAALRAVRKRDPQAVVVALPVASSDAAADLRERADVLVCLEIPPFFMSVGEFYDDFTQVDDATALDLLQRANGRSADIVDNYQEPKKPRA